MVIVDVDGSASYGGLNSPSRLAWSEGWQPPGAHSALIKWTLAMALSHDDSTINITVVIIIIIIIIVIIIIVSTHR